MTTLRFVLASPSEVSDERRIVEKIINEIRSLVERALDLTIVSSRWEDLSSEFNESGPQAIIGKALRIDESDLFIAIFATQLGTALPDGRSGTELEFDEAYSSWLARGRPEIMLYFKQVPVESQNTAAAPQTDAVQGFRNRVAQLNSGLWCKYVDEDDFEEKLRLALIEFSIKKASLSKASPLPATRERWFVRLFPNDGGLAVTTIRDQVMKDLQRRSSDTFLTLRSVNLESDLLVVEGRSGGYSAVKRQFMKGNVKELGPLKIRDVWQLDLSPSDLVQPLYRADSHLLQVLVRKLSLKRRSPERQSGIRVQLEFDRKSPAIWRREARVAVRQHLTNAEKQKCQKKIDDVIHGRTDLLEFDDPDFPFRHANGGVLPIIRDIDGDYYCLFYRETAPIGWNIANGGSDDSDELLDPTLTILRELREELIVVGPPTSNKRYTLFGGDEGAHSRPEYLKALHLWNRKLAANRLSGKHTAKQAVDSHGDWPSLDPRRKRDVPADITWEPGPDELSILGGDYGNRKVSDVFVNITAEDCAIEVDRIAILTTPAEYRLLDGEVYGGQLVNRPIGLFRIDRFNNIQDLGESTREFVPDKIFYSGALSDEPIRNLIWEHIVQQKATGLVTEGQYGEWDRETKLKLCPITRTVIGRHIQIKFPEHARPIQPPRL